MDQCISIHSCNGFVNFISCSWSTLILIFPSHPKRNLNVIVEKPISALLKLTSKMDACECILSNWFKLWPYFNYNIYFLCFPVPFGTLVLSSNKLLCFTLLLLQARFPSIECPTFSQAHKILQLCSTRPWVLLNNHFTQIRCLFFSYALWILPKIMFKRNLAG